MICECVRVQDEWRYLTIARMSDEDTNDELNMDSETSSVAGGFFGSVRRSFTGVWSTLSMGH